MSRPRRLRRLQTRLVLVLALTTLIPLGAVLVLTPLFFSAFLELALHPEMELQLEGAADQISARVRERRVLYEALTDALAGQPALTSPDRLAIERLLAGFATSLPWVVEASLLERGAPLVLVPGTSAHEQRTVRLTRSLRADRTLSVVYLVEQELFDKHQDAQRGLQLLRYLRQNQEAWADWAAALFFSIMGLVIVTTFAGGWVMSRGVARRLSALVGGIERVRGGDVGFHLEVGAEDEVGQLTAAFDDMLAELRDHRDRILYLESMSGWQDLARRLAHEIKNPLTPIRLAVQEMRQQYPGGDQRYRELLEDASEIVEEEVAALQRLVEGFSRFAKLPDVAPEPLDLNEAVADFVRSLSVGHEPMVLASAAGSVQASLTQTAAPLPVSIDRDFMRHVLGNLVTNAAEAGAQRLALETRLNAPWAELVVTDDGPGIPANELARVFEPYYTTKSSGTGLGLAIVKKLVLQHRGTIVAEPVRTGARFRVRLPLR